MSKSLDTIRESSVYSQSTSYNGSLIWLHNNLKLCTEVRELLQRKNSQPYFYEDSQLLNLDKPCHLIILSIDDQSTDNFSKLVDSTLLKRNNIEVLLHLNSSNEEVNQQIESSYENRDRISIIDKITTPRECVVLIPALISKSQLRSHHSEEKEGNFLSLKVKKSASKDLNSLVACGMAHDVNNILTAIQGRVWYLEKIARIQDQDQNDYTITPKQAFMDVSRWILKIKSLLTQLIVMTKDKAFKQTEVDLNEVLKSSMELANSLICESVKVTLRLPEKSALTTGDSTLLEQVILNLCINAKNAISTNGKLDVQLTKYEKIDDTFYHRIQLKDNGKGINPSHINNIFDPFFSTDTSTKGHGLGLFMCKQIVEKHHGFIEVQSTLNSGTVFTINLPVSNNQLEQRTS